MQLNILFGRCMLSTNTTKNQSHGLRLSDHLVILVPFGSLMVWTKEVGDYMVSVMAYRKCLHWQAAVPEALCTSHHDVCCRQVPGPLG